MVMIIKYVLYSYLIDNYTYVHYDDITLGYENYITYDNEVTMYTCII